MFECCWLNFEFIEIHRNISKYIEIHRNSINEHLRLAIGPAFHHQGAHDTWDRRGRPWGLANQAQEGPEEAHHPEGSPKIAANKNGMG